jgi:hypothetical protein
MVSVEKLKEISEVAEVARQSIVTMAMCPSRSKRMVIQRSSRVRGRAERRYDTIGQATTMKFSFTPQHTAFRPEILDVPRAEMTLEAMAQAKFLEREAAAQVPGA